MSLPESRWIELRTAAGPVQAWLAEPSGAPRGGIVVVQEIFGANAHIRSVADQYAAEGYRAIAPGMFDPVEKDVQLGYDAAGFARGRELVGQLGFDQALHIVQSAADALAVGDRVGVVGYCWGGTVALLSAIRLALPAVSYYGGRNKDFLDQAPRAPVMFHFGDKDAHIGPDVVQAHRDRLPQMSTYTYPADHAFNRDIDPNAYEPVCAALAKQRSLDFFAQYVG